MFAWSPSRSARSLSLDGVDSMFSPNHSTPARRPCHTFNSESGNAFPALKKDPTGTEVGAPRTFTGCSHTEVPPLQGSDLLLNPTQGFTLGYSLAPFQGSGGGRFQSNVGAPPAPHLSQSTGQGARAFIVPIHFLFHFR